MWLSRSGGDNEEKLEKFWIILVYIPLTCLTTRLEMIGLGQNLVVLLIPKL